MKKILLLIYIIFIINCGTDTIIKPTLDYDPNIPSYKNYTKYETKENQDNIKIPKYGTNEEKYFSDFENKYQTYDEYRLSMQDYARYSDLEYREWNINITDDNDIESNQAEVVGINKSNELLFFLNTDTNTIITLNTVTQKISKLKLENKSKLLVIPSILAQENSKGETLFIFQVTNPTLSLIVKIDKNNNLLSETLLQTQYYIKSYKIDEDDNYIVLFDNQTIKKIDKNFENVLLETDRLEVKNKYKYRLSKKDNIFQYGNIYFDKNLNTKLYLLDDSYKKSIDYSKYYIFKEPSVDIKPNENDSDFTNKHTLYLRYSDFANRLISLDNIETTTDTKEKIEEKKKDKSIYANYLQKKEKIINGKYLDADISVGITPTLSEEKLQEIIKKDISLANKNISRVFEFDTYYPSYAHNIYSRLEKQMYFTVGKKDNTFYIKNHIFIPYKFDGIVDNIYYFGSDTNMHLLNHSLTSRIKYISILDKKIATSKTILTYKRKYEKIEKEHSIIDVFYKNKLYSGKYNLSFE